MCLHIYLQDKKESNYSSHFALPVRQLLISAEYNRSFLLRCIEFETKVRLQNDRYL